MSTKSMIEGYCRRGWAVFPVKGKIPLTEHGHNDATLGVAQISVWAKAFPGCGWGVRTGVDSDVVVLDVDAKPSVRDALASIEAAGHVIPKTYVVRTGSGGRHYYFRHPGHGLKIKTLVGIFPGVDVRGDGGYVVAPPSPHESGGTYEVIRDRVLAKCPEWLIKICSQAQSTPAKMHQDAPGGVVAEGGRDQYLTALAGAMRRKGASQEAIQGALRAENRERCSPPLSDGQLYKIARSVSRYTPEDAPATIELSEQAFVAAPDLLPEMRAFLKDDLRKLGVPTGVSFLDGMLGGGFRLGEVTGLTAVAKAGKSSFLHWVMTSILRSGEPCAFASREMSPATEVVPNILSVAAGRNVWKDGLSPATEAFDLSKLYFAKGFGYFSATDFRSWAMSLKQLRGVRFFFLDHLLQALENPEDFQECSRYMRALKAFAQEQQIHLFLIIQPTKLQYGQGISQNTLRGGSNIGQNLDNLFTLERVAGHRNVSRLHLELGRSKLASMGDEVYVQYDQSTTQFFEVQPEFEEEAE